VSVDNFLLSASATDLNYPEIRPSLDLNFARTKTLDPRITFTRSSGGSYVGVDGLIKYAGVNEARFDHNPITGESLGLLVEEQRTNSFQRSEEFDNAYWAKGNLEGTLTANQAVAPDGATTADLYQEDTATIGRYIGRSQSFTSGTTYSFSCWAKQAPGATRYLGLILASAAFGANAAASFTLSGAGSFTISTSGTNTSAQIQAFPNGWYRCTLISQATVTTSASIQIRLSSSASSAGNSYTGDGTSGLYVWGAQLEAGAFPTSYIPTTTAAATRSADVARITGANFSSWYRQDEGTVFADASSYMGSAAVTRGVVSIEGAAGDVHRIFRQSDLQPVAQTLVSNTSQATFGFGAIWSTAASRRISYAYAVNNYAGSIDGGAAQKDTTGVLPAASTLNIGNLSGGNQFGGTIRRLTYWPKRLPDAQLRVLTR
jgi:hypothetical protein